MPTTGPTLLADTFADTIPEGAQLVAPTIWECTRFCLNEDILGRNNREEALLATGELLSGLGEVALKAGIETIVANFDPLMLRVYRRVGCEVEILGSTHMYGKPVYLGAFHVSEPHLRKIKTRLASKRANLHRTVAGHELAA